MNEEVFTQCQTKISTFLKNVDNKLFAPESVRHLKESLNPLDEKEIMKRFVEMVVPIEAILCVEDWHISCGSKPLIPRKEYNLLNEVRMTIRNLVMKND